VHRFNFLPVEVISTLPLLLDRYRGRVNSGQAFSKTS
jgi:hypothetical protein